MKKVLPILLSLVFVFSMVLIPSEDASAATTVRFKQKNVTIEVGASAVLTLSGVSSSGSAPVFSCTSKNIILETNVMGESNKCRVIGCKTGTVTVKCKYKNKNYSCKVKVVKSTEGITYKSNSASGVKFMVINGKSSPSAVTISANGKIKFTGFVDKKGRAFGDCVIEAKSSGTYLMDEKDSSTWILYANFFEGFPTGNVYVYFPRLDATMVGTYADFVGQKNTIYYSNGNYTDIELDYDTITSIKATIRKYDNSNKCFDTAYVGTSAVTLAE